jgi:putative transposase
MPWQEHQLVEIRKEFIVRALAPGANKAELFREYGITPKTGYKWLARYRTAGEIGLRDRSRRPHHLARSVDGEVVLLILELRQAYRSWGPKKIRRLLRDLVRPRQLPSVKTIARVLDRAGEPKIRRRRPGPKEAKRERVVLVAREPNEVWTADFKGWWRTQSGDCFEPLTVRDAFSRYVLCLRVLPSKAFVHVMPVFEELFRRHGLPGTIRVDNGTPFGCVRAAAGLSRLSAWWISLGIKVSFSRPAHPQDNGAHERMHADVSFELASMPANTLVEQQRLADEWRHEFNTVRPHEALNQERPAKFYRRSRRKYRGPRAPEYPSNYAQRTVETRGTVQFNGKRPFISTSLMGHPVGLRPCGEGKLHVRFYEIDLGEFELASAPPSHPEQAVARMIREARRRTGT